MLTNDVVDDAEKRAWAQEICQEVLRDVNSVWQRMLEHIW